LVYIATEVTLFAALDGSGKPSVTSTSISKNNSRWSFDGSSESSYLSKRIRVSNGMSDSNTLLVLKSSSVQYVTFFNLSP